MTATDPGQRIIKLNVGCGLDPVPGWENLDNSWSLVISSHRVLRLGFDVLERVTRRRLYTRFPAGVRRQDVTKRLPYSSESVVAIYSSHMLEHLPRGAAERFLREAYRVLGVVEEGLRGLGHPSAVLWAELGGVGVTAVALLTLLPQWGILGAALASLLGYAGVSAMLLVQAAPAAAIRSWTTLCPTGEDLGAVWDRLIGVMRGSGQ